MLILYVLTQKLPFPFKNETFDLIISISFFNHFACSCESPEIVNRFFQELERIATKTGRIYIDAMPNRLSPFQGELSLSAIIASKQIRMLAEHIISVLPIKWVPIIPMNVMWHTYRGLYKFKQNKLKYDALWQASLSRETFLRYLSGELPEINLRGLPISLCI